MFSVFLHVFNRIGNVLLVWTFGYLIGIFHKKDILDRIFDQLGRLVAVAVKATIFYFRSQGSQFMKMTITFTECSSFAVLGCSAVIKVNQNNEL